MMLKTPRLILKPQALADAADIFAILSDPEAMRFWSRPAIPRLAVVQELMREQQAAMDQGLCRYWTLHSNGHAIGSVDLSLIQEASAELGFVLRSDHWGAGLASEAVEAVIAHAFDALRLSRLAAVAQSANRAAVRVLEKNGFALIETRPVMIADGQRKDCAFYLLTRENL